MILSALLALFIVFAAIWLIVYVAVKVSWFLLKAFLWCAIVVFALGLLAGLFSVFVP